MIKKLLWGDVKAQSLALDGLDRYINGEGYYSSEGEGTMLESKSEDPVSFWRHVARSSLQCDQLFAKEIGIVLCCAFANQSASERLNKYMADSAGDKKRTGLDLEKTRAAIDLKVHLMYSTRKRSRRQKLPSNPRVSARLRLTSVLCTWRRGHVHERRVS